ncbi:MAG: TetR/AcrR family transcriptional regulator [Sandaracinaceae bacterium]|nr:TetR/AcrR family transcriptional regulator [Sandaracinaceae bacterium]
MKPVKRDAPRRGRPRSDRARRAILEATRDQLGQHGYEQLSIQHIADAACVGKQTVYRWWSSKRALVAECVIEGYVLPVGEGPADTGDLREDMRAWFRELATQYGREPQVSLLRALTAAAAESEEVAAKLLARFGDPLPLHDRVEAGRGTRLGNGPVRCTPRARGRGAGRRARVPCAEPRACRSGRDAAPRGRALRRHRGDVEQRLARVTVISG